MNEKFFKENVLPNIGTAPEYRNDWRRIDTDIYVKVHSDLGTISIVSAAILDCQHIDVYGIYTLSYRNINVVKNTPDEVMDFVDAKAQEYRALISMKIGLTTTREIGTILSQIANNHESLKVGEDGWCDISYLDLRMFCKPMKFVDSNPCLFVIDLGKNFKIPYSQFFAKAKTIRINDNANNVDETVTISALATPHAAMPMFIERMSVEDHKIMTDMECSLVIKELVENMLH